MPESDINKLISDKKALKVELINLFNLLKSSIFLITNRDNNDQVKDAVQTLDNVIIALKLTDDPIRINLELDNLKTLINFVAHDELSTFFTEISKTIDNLMENSVQMKLLQKLSSYVLDFWVIKTNPNNISHQAQFKLCKELLENLGSLETPADIHLKLHHKIVEFKVELQNANRNILH